MIFTDENGTRTGWNTDLIMRAPEHIGTEKDKEDDSPRQSRAAPNQTRRGKRPAR